MEAISARPVLGMICGSGLGSLARLVEDSVVLPYREIPNFPVSTAPGHQGQLVIGKLSGVCVVLMQGRLHVYEVEILIAAAGGGDADMIDIS